MPGRSKKKHSGVLMEWTVRDQRQPSSLNRGRAQTSWYAQPVRLSTLPGPHLRCDIRASSSVQAERAEPGTTIGSDRRYRPYHHVLGPTVPARATPVLGGTVQPAAGPSHEDGGAHSSHSDVPQSAHLTPYVCPRCFIRCRLLMRMFSETAVILI